MPARIRFALISCYQERRLTNGALFQTRRAKRPRRTRSRIGQLSNGSRRLRNQSVNTQAQLATLGESLGTAIVTGLGFLLENQQRIAEIMLKLAGALALGAVAIGGLLIVIGGQIVAGILAGILESLGAGQFEVATFNELGGILTNIADNALLAAKVIGLDIILGIIGGLEEGISQLVTTVQQIGTIITTTISEQLGIQSPSTVFFDFGVDILQGLIDGIISILPQVGELLSGLFGSLLGGEDGGDTASVIDFTATLEALNVLLPEATAVFIELFACTAGIHQCIVIF